MLGIVQNCLKEWIKENKGEFLEESIESQILPTLLNSLPYLKDMPYMLGIFPFECEEILFSGRYTHTTYKIPTRINYDAYCKYEGMEITINRGSFNKFFKKITQTVNSNTSIYGCNVGVIDVMIFKFLGSYQMKFPIFFKSNKFVGPVKLMDWNINEASIDSYFNATLKQTVLRKLNTFESQGAEGKTITL